MSLIPFAPFFTADFLAPFLALLLEGPAVCSASLQARFVAIRESRIGRWSARGRASRPERTRRTRRGTVVPRGAGHGGRGARAPQGLGAWLFAGTKRSPSLQLGFCRILQVGNLRHEGRLVARAGSHPQRPIESAVLDRFADVIGRDVGRSGKIGDGAGDFQNAIVGAGAQV